MSTKSYIISDNKSLLYRYIIFIIVIITGLNMPVNAQEKDTTNQFKIDFIKMFDSSSLKTTELAASIPAEHYDWRPADEVRSIRETLLHLAGTNYFLASVLNSPVSEGINPREFSKSVKTKKATQEILAISIDHIRAAIQRIDNDQLFTKVDFFGRKETMQRVILQVGEHMAEHLGQLIVYARIKGVPPPWSK